MARQQCAQELEGCLGQKAQSATQSSDGYTARSQGIVCAGICSRQQPAVAGTRFAATWIAAFQSAGAKVIEAEYYFPLVLPRSARATEFNGSFQGWQAGDLVAEPDSGLPNPAAAAGSRLRMSPCIWFVPAAVSAAGYTASTTSKLRRSPESSEERVSRVAHRSGEAHLVA